MLYSKNKFIKMSLKKTLIFDGTKIDSYKALIILLTLLFLSAIINFSARVNEKNIWQDNPSLYQSEGMPLIRTGDPAYFVSIAQYLKKDIPVTEYENKLNFPSISENPTIPLLSKLIALLSKGSSLSEIVSAGNKIVLFCSVITSIGIFYLFFVIGRPYEGIVASVGAGITYTFFDRSSIGYFDTDILNLFFMYFLFAVIYMASRKQSWTKTILFVIFAGLVGKIFNIWYPKPELILMSFFSLAFFTVVNSKDWKKFSVNCLIYILLTDPNLYYNSFNIILNNPYLAGYLSTNVQVSDLVNSSSLNFNSIFRFIGEQQKLPITEMLGVGGSIYLGTFCILGLALWGITYPMLFIGFAPLSLFFLFSIILGQRAIFYSLPFMWFGFGYLINFIIFKFLSLKKTQIENQYIYLFTSLSIIIFSVLFTNVFSKMISATYISANTTKAFIKMNDLISDKKNAVIAANWTYGYQSLLYNDIPILIHPGIPTSPRHYFMSRAFTASDLKETTKIINYVVTGNVEKINEKNLDNFVSLSKDLYKTPMSKKEIFIMLTQQQRKWMKADAATAYWDIENNLPYYFNGKTAFDVFNIIEINCDDLDTTTLTTKCASTPGSKDRSIPVNLALGTYNDVPVLKRVVQISNGKVEINQEYKNSEGDIVFQIVKNLDENTSNLYLMHEVVFRSAYNKLFHLNQSDNYELIYDDYPNVKIYKIN